MGDIQGEFVRAVLNVFKWIFQILWWIIQGIFKLITYIYHEVQQHRAAQAEREILDPSIPRELRSDTGHGFVFGQKHEDYIIKPEEKDGHIMVVGGVGSGKTSCIAIPTLRAWRSRVFAIDIKGELYENTKKYRPNIKVFNPQDENSYGYDPFLFLKSKRLNQAQEARAIAQAVLPLPPETKEPFWIESAQTILTGAILHHYKYFSFVETLKEIQSHSPRELIEIIADSSNEKARLCVNSFVDMEDKTLSGIFSELSRGIITLVTDDELVSALSREKIISPADLEHGEDIYITIPEHLLRQWKDLFTLIVNQFLTAFEKRSERNTAPILFMLDEFPRLGKIPAIMDGLATLRSKKISICLIMQSLAQLDMIYGTNERKVISDTCSYKAILSATDADTQEYFSRLVDTYDKMRTSDNMNYDPLIGLPTGRGTNIAPEEKRIMKPSEFARLRDIVLLSPQGYFRVDKTPYYNDDEE